MWNMKSLLFVLVVMIVIPITAHAEPLQVQTSQDVYAYGDFLSFTVTVPAITQETATFRIIDGAGVSSSELTMSIIGDKTVLTASNPFIANQYKVGTYTIKVEYDNNVATSSFELIDSGKVIIPFWIKDISRLWLEDVIDDGVFFKNLIDAEIIKADQYTSNNSDITIPSWYKATVQWWINGYISNNEFVQGLQYLVKADIISIG